MNRGERALRPRLRKFVLLVLVPAVVVSAVFSGPRAACAEEPERWLPVDDAGWTILKPSADSRIIYISNSDGDDATGRFYSPDDPTIGDDPLLPADRVSAYKTLFAALEQARDDHPDWVLLKRGDVWSETIGSPPSGRSAAEPLVIAGYGEGSERPRLQLRGKATGVRFGIHEGFHNIAVVGLEFYAIRKDPASPEFSEEDGVKTGVSLFVSSKPRAHARRLLVEDCCFRYCGTTFQLASDREVGLPPPVEQIVFRRNLVLDNYSRDSHSQGTYAARIPILLEENIYDHNGWLIQERGNRKAGGGATIFNHNTYFTDCHDVTFRGNMFLRASSIGNKWTANHGPASARNLVMDDNLYVEGEIGISAGGNKPGPLRFKNMAVTNNVLLHVGRGRPTLRNLGWGIEVADWDGGVVANNLHVHRQSDGVTNVFSLNVKASEDDGLCRDVAIRNNVFYGAPVIFRNARGFDDVVFAANTVAMTEREGPLIRAGGELSGMKFSNNDYDAAGAEQNRFRVADETIAFSDWKRRMDETRSTMEDVKFPDPERTIETYMAHLGLEPAFVAFIAEVRKQSRANWRPEFTAAAVNEWVREGFGVEPMPSPAF